MQNLWKQMFNFDCFQFNLCITECIGFKKMKYANRSLNKQKGICHLLVKHELNSIIKFALHIK